MGYGVVNCCHPADYVIHSTCTCMFLMPRNNVNYGLSASICAICTIYAAVKLKQLADLALFKKESKESAQCAQ